MTDVFNFFTKIWLSLSYLTKPFFEWLNTELEIIEMTPFEMIFGLGIVLIMGRVILKFISGV